MNIFQKYFDQGKIRNTADLKSIYHILALRLHPDSKGDYSSQDGFILLKRDYDYFLDYLLNQMKGDKYLEKAIKEKDLFELFTDLEATGFLLSRSKKKYTKHYLNRIEQFNKMKNVLKISGFSDLGIVEKELLSLQKQNDEAFRITKFLIENIIYYSYENRLFLKNAIKKLYIEYRRIGYVSSLTELNGFIQWLMKYNMIETLTNVDTRGI